MTLPVEVGAKRIEDAPVDYVRFWSWLGVIANKQVIEISVTTTCKTHISAIIAAATFTVELVGPMAIRLVVVIVVAEAIAGRSEERRVGKECRTRWSPDY